MKTLSIKPHSPHIALPVINRVTADEPFIWLRKGWDDLRANWASSLTLGAVFASLGYMLVNFAWSRPHLVMALTVGFLFVAPFLAVGFYDLSRRRESAEPIEAFAGVRGNGPSIGMYAVFLAFALSAWERLSAIMVGLFLRSDLEASSAFSLNLLFSPEHLGFVIPYMIAAGIYAAVIFAASVVTLPLLIDRQVDVVTALMTSLLVVRENPLPMLAWALIIGVSTLIGQLLWFVPLAVIFPLLGHATWHAYRDLVERE